uniref:Uncharacterized protein n=1 Tax=Globodera rostochiensis TaxID=31243 RepID=A0A914HG11_GLORO
MAGQFKKFSDNDDGRGKRLQIRGFPTIWTEKLTFDDIGWFLFEMLVKYGSIDNISVTKSKNSVVYGIVDMLRVKDAQKIFDNFPTGKRNYRLEEWNSTLQFKLLGVNDEQATTGARVVTTVHDANIKRYGREEIIELKSKATPNFQPDEACPEIRRLSESRRAVQEVKNDNEKNRRPVWEFKKDSCWVRSGPPRESRSWSNNKC